MTKIGAKASHILLAKTIDAVSDSAQLLRGKAVTLAGQANYESSSSAKQHRSHNEVLSLVQSSSDILKNSKISLLSEPRIILKEEDRPGGAPADKTFELPDAENTKRSENAQKSLNEATYSHLINTTGSQTTPPPENAPPPGENVKNEPGAENVKGAEVRSEFLGNTAAGVSPAVGKPDGSQQDFSKDVCPGNEAKLAERLIDPQPAPTNDKMSMGQSTSPAEDLKTIRELSEFIAKAIDATDLLLEAAKASGVRSNGAPGPIGVLSTMISASVAYDESNSPEEFAYKVSTDAAKGYAALVVGTTVSGALKGSRFGPYGALAVGVAAGLSTTVCLENCYEIGKAAIGEVGAAFSPTVMEYEIWNLYMRGRM